MGRLQAIIFDYDGVLADTEPLHLRALQETLGAAGVDLRADTYFERYLGLDDEGVFRAVSDDQGLGWPPDRFSRLVEDKARRFRRNLVHLVPGSTRHGARPATDGILFPGVAPRLLEWSAVLPLAIASGSLREEIEPVLRANGLNRAVPVIVAAGETERGKPWPDPYIRALELLASARGPVAEPLAASLCVAVEDSPWGIDSAHAAGMKVAAVTTSYPAERLASADVVAESLARLDLDALERLVCSGQSARR